MPGHTDLFDALRAEAEKHGRFSEFDCEISREGDYRIVDVKGVDGSRLWMSGGTPAGIIQAFGEWCDGTFDGIDTPKGGA